MTEGAHRSDGPKPRAKKSVITCDLEGRIETYGKDAVEIFGYQPEEVIGKKRVSLFSPGMVVLQHVAGWLEAARDQGAFEGQTVFLKKDGTPFAADIRITPTRRAGQHIGYCGVTIPRDDVAVEAAMPPIRLRTRIFAALAVTRAPFLTAVLVPVLVGAAAFAHRAGPERLSLGLLGLVVLAAASLHVAANTFNDYFDTRSGADEANNDYFLPFSGGSRAVELGLISLGGLWRIAVASLGVAAALGVYFAMTRTWHVLLIGLVGAFSAYFYTAPPLYLAARRGLGELFVGLNFGPLAMLGTMAVLAGGVTAAGFRDVLWLGVPVGLLTTAILWINQLPDERGDRAVGKRNLVVVLGKRRARWPFLALLAAALLMPVLGVMLEALPSQVLLVLLALPLAVQAGFIAVEHYADRSLVRANRATILLQLVGGLLLASGTLWAAFA